MMFKSIMIAGALLGASYLPVAADELDESNLYRGPSGTLYKYDLSNPSDQLRYSVDPGAQLRDLIDPRVELDRSLGQYGGGVRH